MIWELYMFLKYHTQSGTNCDDGLLRSYSRIHVTSAAGLKL